MSAKAFQQARDAAELANHHDRVAWLSNERPVWACGEAVSPFDRIDLLRQSRGEIDRLAKKEAP